MSGQMGQSKVCLTCSVTSSELIMMLTQSLTPAKDGNKPVRKRHKLSAAARKRRRQTNQRHRRIAFPVEKPEVEMIRRATDKP